MTAISLRQEAANLGITDLSSGFLDAVLNPFWKTNRSLFPFRNANGISLRAIAQTWKWPTGWTLGSVHPNDSDTANYADIFQGIACDGNAWYLTNGGRKSVSPEGLPEAELIVEPRLWRRDLAFDLDTFVNLTVSGVHFVTLPTQLDDSYVHFGDLCVHYPGVPLSQPVALVPVEFGDKPNHLVAWKINAPANPSPADPYMEFFAAEELMQDAAGAPWFATFPGGQLGFCSSFFGDRQPTVVIHIYQVSFTGTSMNLAPPQDPLAFELFFNDGSAFDVGHIQGGAVSAAGHLYLVSEMPEAEGGGLYGFDLVSGRKMEYLPLGAAGGDFELEGVCIFNTFGAPNATGQIHVGKIRPELHDNLFIYHIHAFPGEEGLV